MDANLSVLNLVNVKTEGYFRTDRHYYASTVGEGGKRGSRIGKLFSLCKEDDVTNMSSKSP